VLSILTVFVRGMGGQDLITIPEGQTARDLARLFEQRLGTDPEEFLAAVADSALVAEFGAPQGATLEGYLFPETYAFLPTTAPVTIVRTMAGKARRVLDEELARGGPIAVELTPHEILTLASIVEAEAMRASERPRIAAVYLNRMRRHMLLQADPTVQYALGGHHARIFYSDLKVQSPYNTYLHPGLPPGPIGNPGRASIQAVLNRHGLEYDIRWTVSALFMSGGGRKSIRSTIPNIAALAPMPRASVMTTPAVNPGRRRMPRRAYRKSCRRVSSMYFRHPEPENRPPGAANSPRRLLSVAC